MGEHESEPKSPLLTSLLARERLEDPLSDEALEHMRERLEARVWATKLGTGMSAVRVFSRRVGASALLFVAGAGMGALATRETIDAPHVEAVRAIETSPVRVDPPESQAEVFPPVPDPVAPQAVRPSRNPPSELAGERALLEAARAALVRDQPEQALAALERHRRRHAQGALVEERDSLTVIATSHVDLAAAEALANDFERAHPRSLLLPAIRAALASAQRAAVSPNERTSPTE